MLRLVALLLLFANAAWFAWSQGLLLPWGFGPAQQAEPQRLAQQIRPESVRLLKPDEVRRIEAAAAAVRPEPERVERARAWELVIVGTAFVLLSAPLVWYARVTSQDIREMAGPEMYRGGVEWLTRNAEKGELILNTDWDDFPKLFFYNPNFAYISGLDPTYLLDRDKRLSDLYAKITIGRDLSEDEVANLGRIIRDNFCVGEGAARRCVRYAFTDHEHEDFYNHALDSGWFDEVYSDGDCAILRLRDEKGDPPPDNLPPAGQNAEGAGGDAGKEVDEGADESKP